MYRGHRIGNAAEVLVHFHGEQREDDAQHHPTLRRASNPERSNCSSGAPPVVSSTVGFRLFIAHRERQATLSRCAVLAPGLKDIASAAARFVRPEERRARPADATIAAMLTERTRWCAPRRLKNNQAFSWINQAARKAFRRFAAS